MSPTIYFSKQFIKHFEKRILPHKNILAQYEKRLKLFLNNRNDPQLRDHQLKGIHREYRSFSVAGDIRVIYKELTDGALAFSFIDIGSHNQVY